MVFEKKMSVKDLIEQMRDELKKEQEDDGIVAKPTAKKAKAKAKPVKKAKAKKAAKPKKKKK